MVAIGIRQKRGHVNLDVPVSTPTFAKVSEDHRPPGV